MKRLFLTFAIAVYSIATIVAQPRAIGARLSYGIEASYQHYTGETNFIQADLGLNLGYSHAFGLNLVGTYNWIIFQPQWTDSGSWDFYLGLGVGLGSYFGSSSYYGSGYSQFGLGVAGNIGLSYTFDFPLQLAIEERPIIGIQFGSGDTSSWGAYHPAFAIRYSF